MRSPIPWSPSLPILVGLNTALTTAAICLGADLSGLGASSTVFGVGVSSGAACDRAAAVTTILGGNLLVGGALLAGACTMGGFTLLTLRVNGFMLGASGSLLLQEFPTASHLLWRYAPLEFGAFAIVAGTSQHLAQGVFRGLAFDEAPPFGVSLVGLAAWATLLFVAEVLESDVYCLLRRGIGGG